jgi:integrase
MDKHNEPSPEMPLLDFITQCYGPTRKLGKRSITLYRGLARKFSENLGREAVVSDLPLLARSKALPNRAMQALISVWRYASHLRLVEFDEQLLGALIEHEIATHRLAMIRSDPNAAIDKPRADMALLDFIVCHHMPTPRHRRTKLGGPDLFYKLRHLTRCMEKMLERVPLVSDLTPRTFVALLDYMRVHFSRNSHKNYEGIWMGLWRFAADQGLITPDNLPPQRKSSGRLANRGADGEVVRVEDREGTLWHICVHEYFPVNTRINKQTTKNQYRCALRDFKQHLGHEPMPSDLSDDNISRLMRGMLDRGLKPKTVNERRGRLRALWEWMARKRKVEDFPFVKNLKCPKRLPRAWTRQELTTLFDACRTAPGRMKNKVLACDWWTALHLVLWDTGARIGEIIACEWDWLDTESGQLVVCAEVRKGADRDMAYVLHQSTLAVLMRIRALHKRLIFGEVETNTLYYQYRKLRSRAGLPLGGQHGFHKMRRTVATWLQRGGHNATDVLKHSSPAVTRDHYLDPTIIGGIHPSEVLFRPNEAQEPPRLGYVSR